MPPRKDGDEIILPPEKRGQVVAPCRKDVLPDGCAMNDVCQMAFLLMIFRLSNLLSNEGT